MLDFLTSDRGNFHGVRRAVVTNGDWPRIADRHCTGQRDGFDAAGWIDVEDMAFVCRHSSHVSRERLCRHHTSAKP